MVENEQLTLVVADDGAGFLVEEAEGLESGHLGLTLMCERARQSEGTLSLTSRQGRGTEVQLQVPIG
jgi:signal transduction histidine kinase